MLKNTCKLECHHWLKSNDNVKLLVGKEVDFAKGLSDDGEGLLPTGLPCLFIHNNKCLNLGHVKLL